MADEMDIVLEQEYTINHKRLKFKPGEKVSQRTMDQLPQFTCHVYVQQMEMIMAGRKSGELVQWKLQRGKEGTMTDANILGKHAGSITCILYHHEHSKMLITGSSDSSINVWDIYGTGIEGNRCVQSIPAHSATVTALAAHCDVILSCSCDRTLKVWKAEEGRSALKYPWFTVKQLFVFDYWTTCVWSFPSKIAEDTLGEVYVGDAGGGLTQLRSVAAHQLDSEQVSVDELRLVRPHVRSFRSLGLTAVLPVPTLNVILTCTYDDAVRLSDISTIDTLVNLPNSRNPGQRFVSMAWSPTQEELVLADAEGDISIWNSRMDKFVAATHAGLSVSTVSVATIGGRPVIMVTTLASVMLFTVKRTLPYKRHAGHTQRIVGITLFTNPETDKGASDENQCLLTASADNTLCVWNVIQSLDCTKTLVEKYSEISCSIYIHDERVVVTGHENGGLKIWGLQTEKTWRGPGHTNTIAAMTYATHRHNAHGVLEERPHIVTAAFDGYLGLWETNREAATMQAKCELRWRVCRDELLTVVHDPLKHTYITAGNAGEITTWSLTDPQKPCKTMSMQACNNHEFAVTCLALDGNYLFSGSEDGLIRMWDTHSGGLLKVLRDDGELNGLVLLPSTGNLLSCNRAGCVKMWSPRRGAVLGMFASPNQEELRCVAYCRDTDEVFVGTEEGGILRVTLEAVASGDDSHEVHDETLQHLSPHKAPGSHSRNQSSASALSDNETIPEEGVLSCGDDEEE